MPETGRRIVIGLGNPDRGDDAAGRAVVRALRGTLPAEVEIAEENGEATALLARLVGVAEAWLVDAAVSGADPGTLRRFDVAAVPLPAGMFGLSTHGFGLAEALELARALGTLPDRCIVYAIEGAAFAPGAPLTPAVADAVADAARLLRNEIAANDITREPEQCTKPR